MARTKEDLVAKGMIEYRELHNVGRPAWYPVNLLRIIHLEDLL